MRWRVSYIRLLFEHDGRFAANSAAVRAHTCCARTNIRDARHANVTRGGLFNDFSGATVMRQATSVFVVSPYSGFDKSRGTRHEARCRGHDALELGEPRLAKRSQRPSNPVASTAFPVSSACGAHQTLDQSAARWIVGHAVTTCLTCTCQSEIACRRVLPTLNSTFKSGMLTRHVSSSFSRLAPIH